jgi:hypothetical protein
MLCALGCEDGATLSGEVKAEILSAPFGHLKMTTV